MASDHLYYTCQTKLYMFVQSGQVKVGFGDPVLVPKVHKDDACGNHILKKFDQAYRKKCIWLLYA